MTRAGRDSDWTDAESEGLPSLEDQPPGIDDQTAEEGFALPRDHSVGVDERGVTEAEQARPETLRERVRRERPDAPQEREPGPGGRLVDSAEAEEFAGEWADDGAGLSAEEAALHIEEG